MHDDIYTQSRNCGKYLLCCDFNLNNYAYESILNNYLVEGLGGGGLSPDMYSNMCTCTYVGSIADRFDELFLLSPISVRYPVELCKLLEKDYDLSRFANTSSWLHC